MRFIANEATTARWRFNPKPFFVDCASERYSSKSIGKGKLAEAFQAF
jgi:hypothetical protein